MPSFRNRANSDVGGIQQPTTTTTPHGIVEYQQVSSTLVSSSPANSPNFANTSSHQHLFKNNPELYNDITGVGRQNSSLSIHSSDADLSPTTSVSSNDSRRFSLNPFKKIQPSTASNTSTTETKPTIAKKEIIETERKIVDPREPKLNILSYFTIFRIIGWNFILIFFGLIGAAGRGVIPMVFQYVLGDMLNVFQAKNGVYPTSAEIKTSVDRVAINFAIVAGSSGIASLMTYFFLGWAVQRIGVLLRKAYFNSLTKQEVGFYDIKQTGQLTLPLSEDIYKIQDALSYKLASFVQNVTQFCLGVALAFATSWELTLIMISTSPLMVIGYGILAKFVQIFDGKANKANENSSIIASEVISSIRTVRSMGCEEKEQERFASNFKRTHLFGFIRSCFDGAAWGSFSVVMWGTNALAWWYGGHMVADGKLTVGELMKTFGTIVYSVYGMTEAGIVLPQLLGSFTCMKNLLRVMKRTPEIPFKGGKTIPTLKGDIKFQNISFIYPSRTDVKVLEKFSLNIKAGTSVALVGPSGSGKTTIVQLLERFYETSGGSILLDDVNIKEIDPIWLHKHALGIVTQEPVLFSCTIKENIAYAVGIESVTQEDIERAARTANCHHFIMELPDGYNTKLGEKGISLSGGQKQRIAIARAVLQNPLVLLLDEATSALDTESEGLVQSALDTIMKGRTTICVAHRLSTIRNCDKIVVMVDGEVTEAGSHNELMTRDGGVYKKLVEKQLQLGISEIPMSESIDPASEVAMKVLSRKMTSSVIKI